MRLIVLLFFAGSVLSQYPVKRRFDRSVLESDNQEILATFTDYDTNFVAYKDKVQGVCFLERLKPRSLKYFNFWTDPLYAKRRGKVFYASKNGLTKVEAWKLAGGRVVNFCNGLLITVLQNTRPIDSGAEDDPFQNELPEDENDITQKRVSDVVLTPLISRAKREILLENRQKLNTLTARYRSPRQVMAHKPGRGRFRGQTQSQYLNSGNGGQKEGRADAEATHESSHAVVSEYLRS